MSRKKSARPCRSVSSARDRERRRRRLEEHDVRIESCEAIKKCDSGHRAQVPAHDWSHSSVSRAFGLRCKLERKRYVWCPRASGRQEPSDICLSTPYYALIGSDDGAMRTAVTLPRTPHIDEDYCTLFALCGTLRYVMMQAAALQSRVGDLLEPVDERDERWARATYLTGAEPWR